VQKRVLSARPISSSSVLPNGIQTQPVDNWYWHRLISDSAQRL